MGKEFDREESDFYAAIDEFFDTLLTETEKGRISPEQAERFFPEKQEG